MTTVHRPPAGTRLTLAIQTDKSIAAYREIGAAVEDLGFDGLTAFADLGYQPPIAGLLAAASCSTRLTLGVACWSPSMLHPVEIAGQLAALDDASGGRAYLGLTRGSWLGRIGVSGPGGLSRLGEAVQVIRYLLAGHRTGFSGRHFTIEPGFRLQYPLLRREIPLLLGVWGPRGAAVAATHAAEVKLGGCANPDMVALMNSWLVKEASAIGRAAAVGVVAGAVTVVDGDRAAARRRARTEVAMYLDVVAPLDRTVAVPAELLAQLRSRLRDGDHDRAGALIPDELLDRFCFAGTPDDVAAHAIRLVRAGATRIEFGTPHGLTDLGGIRLLGEQVLPAVRHELETAEIGDTG